MAKLDILGKALARGKAKGEILDKEYLLVEMQKIANELGEVLSGYTAADQGILLFVLRTAEKKHGSGGFASGSRHSRPVGEMFRRYADFCQ